MNSFPKKDKDLIHMDQIHITVPAHFTQPSDPCGPCSASWFVDTEWRVKSSTTGDDCFLFNWQTLVRTGADINDHNHSNTFWTWWTSCETETSPNIRCNNIKRSVISVFSAGHHGQSMQTETSETDGVSASGRHGAHWSSGLSKWTMEVGRKTAAQLLPLHQLSWSLSVSYRAQPAAGSPHPPPPLWRAAMANASHPPGLTCFSALSLLGPASSSLV